MKNYTQFINESLNKDIYEDISSELEVFWKVMKNSFQEVEKFNAGTLPPETTNKSVKKPVENAIYIYKNPKTGVKSKVQIILSDTNTGRNEATIKELESQYKNAQHPVSWECLTPVKKEVSPKKEVPVKKEAPVNTPSPVNSADTEKSKPIVLNPNPENVQKNVRQKKEKIL